MPYTKKEKKLFAALVKQYGLKKALSVYHAMAQEYEKHPGIFSERTTEKVKRKRKK